MVASSIYGIVRSMSPKKETIKKIRTTLFSRGVRLAKASIKAGSLTATQWLSADGTKKPGWINQFEFLIEELGQLKGTAMKVGQTLSMFGEHLLPKEVNDLLKNLQQDSPPLSWDAIAVVLNKELGEDKLKLLEIEQTPVASASIGQVYRARIKATGEWLALKVQYPGIDQAVETDLKLLKFILNMSGFVPRGPRFDQIFEEIREMFYQEIDYFREREFGETFYNLLKSDTRYKVPRIYGEFSTRKVLATEFVPGFRADSEQVQSLSLQRRNRLGLSFLELYLRELLQIKQVQTDPHLGNYLIQIDPEGENDRLVLLDFGAVRGVPEDFLISYAHLMEGGLHQDARMIEKGGRRLKLLLPEDSIDLVKDYVDLCISLVEPFEGGVYDWGENDLPKRVAAKASKIAFSYKLRAPPRELVFLDRKLGGVFIFLSVLKCKMETRSVLLRELKLYSPLKPKAFPASSDHA